MYEFINLVRELALEFYDSFIVIRPHPRESLRINKLLTEDLDNVEVINDGQVDSWIRKCKVLIHNGCFTSLQAMIADKKVISFVSFDGSEMSQDFIPVLLITIGIKVSTEKGVIEVIKSKTQIKK